MKMRVNHRSREPIRSLVIIRGALGTRIRVGLDHRNKWR